MRARSYFRRLQAALPLGRDFRLQVKFVSDLHEQLGRQIVAEPFTSTQLLGPVQTVGLHGKAVNETFNECLPIWAADVYPV